MLLTKRTFPTGGIVGPEDLVDREAIVRELFERTFANLNSVVLAGPRQTGKTSVAEELLREVRKAGGDGVYVDCSAATDERELAELIARSTYDQVSGSRGAFARLKELVAGAPRPLLYQGDINLSLSFFGPAEESTPKLLERALGLADEIASQKNRTCVVVYDEFQRIAGLSPTIVDRVRSVLQHRMTHTAYVFMGSEVGMLDELFRKRAGMPFRLASPVTIPLPRPEAWRTYITERFAALDVPVNGDEIDRLIEATGGHPRDLMEASQHLLVIRIIAPETDGAVDLAVARTLAGLSAEFEELWKQLERPKGTRSTAARIARGQPIYGSGRAAAEASRSVQRLRSLGLIARIGRGRYEFTEPLFGVFVRDLVEG